MAETLGPVWLTLSSLRDADAVAVKVAEAAARASTLNADAGNAQGYAGQRGNSCAVLLAKVTVASISALPEVCDSSVFLPAFPVDHLQFLIIVHYGP